MGLYLARILNDGKVETRILDAANEAAAREQLNLVDGFVLSVVQDKKNENKRRYKSDFSLDIWLQELSFLLEAGLSLVESLETLCEKIKSQSSLSWAILSKMRNTLCRGGSLSQAMSEQPIFFPSLLIATVSAAEGNGQIVLALRRYQYYTQRMSTIRKRILSSLIYPGVIMFTGIGVILFMLFFVIPQFVIVFEGINAPPPTAKLMIWWAAMVRMHGIEIILSMLISVFLFFLIVRHDAMKFWLYRIPWRVPRVKNIAHCFVLARFYRSVGLLLAGGTSLLHALTMSQNLLPIDYISRLILAQEYLRSGKSLADALATQNLTTPVAERLLRVGEKGGNLSEMCERIAQFHDNALDHALDLFSKIIEPLLMLCMGGVVGLIVILLYIPIFELAGSMG